MSEENQTEAPAAPEVDVQALLRSIDNLERKNKELADEKRKLRKLEELQAELPAGTDVKSLLEFKRNHEQQQLESEGKYTEARQALEEQFREATAKKDQRIAELEARVRELEIISPAATALADVVHDPDMILRTQISRE